MTDLFHSLVDGWRRDAASDARVLFIDDPDVPISAFYADADVLISDGSSLVFEFLALERPILLYTSNKQVEKWKSIWDLQAPANRMRDAGMQFSTLETFGQLLPGIFDIHAQCCRDRQRAYADELYGALRDGRAAERAQAAIAALPNLDAAIVAGNSGRQASDFFLGQVEQQLRNVLVRETHETPAIAAPGGTVVWRPGTDHRLGDSRALVRALRDGNPSAGECVDWCVLTPAGPDVGTSCRSVALNNPVFGIERGFRRTGDDSYTSDGRGVLSLGVNRGRRPWEHHAIVTCDLQLSAWVDTARTIRVAVANGRTTEIDIAPGDVRTCTLNVGLEEGSRSITFSADDLLVDDGAPRDAGLFEVRRARVISWIGCSTAMRHGPRRSRRPAHGGSQRRRKA